MNHMRVKRNLILSFLVGLLFCAAAPPAAKSAVIGHRGAAGLGPENTPAAFGKAFSLAVDAIELDVLFTPDGELVVHHDFKLRPEIARRDDGSRVSSFPRPAAKDLTLSETKTSPEEPELTPAPEVVAGKVVRLLRAEAAGGRI
jgi:glycerophosphoryl diester phosphodiesterase